MWWGTLGLMPIEGTVFALAIDDVLLPAQRRRRRGR